MEGDRFQKQQQEGEVLWSLLAYEGSAELVLALLSLSSPAHLVLLLEQGFSKAKRPRA